MGLHIWVVDPAILEYFENGATFTAAPTPTTCQLLWAGTTGSLAVTSRAATLPIIFPESGRLWCQVQDVRRLLSLELIFGESFVLSLWRTRPWWLPQSTCCSLFSGASNCLSVQKITQEQRRSSCWFPCPWPSRQLLKVEIFFLSVSHGLVSEWCTLATWTLGKLKRNKEHWGH